MIKLQTKVRAGFSLQDVVVHIKNADALAQWHPKGKDLYAKSEGEPVISKAIQIQGSEVSLGAVHAETFWARYGNKRSSYPQGKILS